MTEIEAKRVALVASLENYHAELTREAAATRLAISALTGKPTGSEQDDLARLQQGGAQAEAAKRQPRKSEKKAPAKARARAPKKSAKPAPAKRSAPHAIDEPTTRKGRMPSKVKVQVADEPGERKALVADLVKRGYRRAKIGERLAPGVFDVNHRADGVLVT